MFFRRLFAAALTMLVVTGCAQEVVTPGGDRPQPEAPGLTPFGAPEAKDIRDDLILLGQYVTPNDQSFLSKFDALVAALDAGTGFGDELDDLISKINLEVQKYTGPPINGSLLDCVDTENPCTTVGQLRDQIIADLYRFVGLDPDGTICILPANHSAEFCKVDDDGAPAGFVHFPQAIFDQLTFISVKSQGLGSPIGSGLDEYGYTIEVRTAPIATFGPDARPTVVACVPLGLDPDVLNRLLLGHRRSDESDESDETDPPPFSLLAEAVDPGVEAEATDYCGEPTAPSGPSVFGLSADSPLNRLLVSARDLLLPSELAASNAVLLATRGFSGASGSPEEFSTFKAVDRGVTGAGGSPEEFAPQATGGSTPTGHQGGAADSSATIGLPHVIVQTEDGLGVNGVLVTFTLQDPTSLDPDDNPRYPASDASLCTTGSSVRVRTGGTDPETGDSLGLATLPCINFGIKAGFMNLRVTFDPSEVLTGQGFLPGEELCIIETEPVTPGGNTDALGACDTDDTVSQNFLIETVAGPAAAIEIVEGDGQTTDAYTEVAVAPKVVVKDQYGNVAPGAEVDWSANVGTIDPNSGEGSEDTGTTTTGGDGTSALTSWTLGVGANTLLAEINGGAQSVQFEATGTFDLVLANACVTGGAKDDITKFGFYVPLTNHTKGKVIQAIGLNLSSNGAPGLSENYEVTLTATRRVQSGQIVETQIREVKAGLQSGSNSSKGEENLVIFDFGSNPFPSDNRNGELTVRMGVKQVIGGVEQDLPSNRAVNMNAGGCPAGSKNCKPVAVTGARSCEIIETQLNPLVQDYRRGLAAQVFTSP